MKGYQRITIKGTEEELLVSEREFHCMQAGFPYIKFVVYNDITLVPESIQVFQPFDVLKRVQEYSQGEETQLVADQDAAEADYNQKAEQRAEYNRLVADEMAKKAAGGSGCETGCGADTEGLFG